MFRRLRENLQELILNLAIRLVLSIRDFLIDKPYDEKTVKKCRDFVDCLINSEVMEKLFSCLVKSFGREKTVTLAYLLKDISEQLNAQRFVKHVEKIIRDIEHGIIK